MLFRKKRIDSSLVTSAITKSHLSELKKGTEHKPYVFTYERKEYVLKRFFGRDEHLLQDFPARELIHSLNLVYTIAKKYLPIVDTSYFLATDKDGKETIFMLQPFVKGRGVRDIDTLHEMRVLWKDHVIADPAWRSLPPEIQEEFRASDISPNQVIRSQGKNVVIDW